jgi:hypothetical protein
MGSKKPVIPLPPKPETEIATNTAPDSFQVAFIPVDGYATNKQAEMIGKASLKLNQTVKSQCFKDFLSQSALKETNGRTSTQVVAHILSFVDTVQVKMYYKKWGSCLTCTSAIAYRQPPEKKINLNSAYFTEKVSACRWAATMAHESLGHSLGNYGHSSKWNVAREYSVPYKIGGASEKYGSNAFDKCCLD